MIHEESINYYKFSNRERDYDCNKGISEYKWKLDSIVTTRYITEDNSEIVEYPSRLEVFRYDQDYQYFTNHLIYSQYNKSQVSYDHRYETRMDAGSDSLVFEIDRNYKKWNQKVGRIQAIEVISFDTCNQVYTFDSTFRSWIKGTLTCTTHIESDSLSEVIVTYFTNNKYSPYASRFVVVNSNGLKLKEIHQKKDNELTSDWLTTKETIYSYRAGRLTERKDFILSSNGTNLFLKQQRTWTPPKSNVEYYEVLGNEALDSIPYVTYKEIKTTSSDSMILTTEYFNADDKTRTLYKDRSMIQYLNDNGVPIRESTFNYSNGRYDREERIYELDINDRVIKESALYKMNDSANWDTLHIKVFGYGPTNANTKALIHTKSTNRNNGSQIDFYEFKTRFSGENNLIEFYYMPTFVSDETKVAIEYYNSIQDNEVLYPLPAHHYVESAVGPWEKSNPIKTWTSHYYKDGQWLRRSKTEYFYSRI